jgi:hypothetical protein
LLSGTRDRALNEQPIAFLRQHLGLSRFYAAPVPEANYGAYYEIASVNHNYLPVPQNWVDFLHARINPALDAVEFHGSGLTASSGEAVDAPPAPDRMIPVAEILQTYEELAVRYLVLPTGAAPFGDWTEPNILLTDQRAFPLDDGQGFDVTLPPRQVTTGIIRDVGLQIGTYAGHARGVLTIELCDGSNCAIGEIDTVNAKDNAVASLRLDRPLSAVQGDALRAHVSFKGNSRVAVWLWPQTNSSEVVGPDKAYPAKIPFFLLQTEKVGSIPPLVYRDKQVDIRELNHPGDYFTALAGRCRLTPISRVEVIADCASPDTLIRRELFFPGWQAMAGDAEIPIASYDNLLQAVALSSGHHVLKFHYQPLGIVFCYAAFATGLLALAVQTLIVALFNRRLSSLSGR